MLFRYMIANIENIKFTRNTYFPHVCNDSNSFGSGVAGAISRRWPLVKREYHNWYKETNYISEDELVTFKLGRNQFVKVENNVTIVNMIGQSDPGGYYPKYCKYPDQFKLEPIRYQSLEECLYRFRDYIHENENMNEPILDFCVVSPLFGCGLAGGKAEIIKNMVYDIFDDLHLTWTWISTHKDQLEEFEKIDVE